jgi:hypothetical protein
MRRARRGGTHAREPRHHASSASGTGRPDTAAPWIQKPDELQFYLKCTAETLFWSPTFPNTVGICKNFTNISCRATCQLQLWLKNLSLNQHGWRDTKLQRRVPQYWVLQSNCKPTETVFFSPLIFPNYVLIW